MISAQTLPELVFKILPYHNKANCLKAKKGGVYTDISAAEVVQTVEALAARLIDMGVRKGDRVGLLAENRAEWAYTDLAVLCTGAITVPVYCTLPAKQVEYILRDSEMEMLFVSTETQWKKIMEVRKETRLNKIVVMDPFSQKDELTTDLPTILSEGREALKKNPDMVRSRAAECKRDDVFSIIYTSGTTGEPKGVMLTHGNVLSNVEGIQSRFTFTPEDVALSFLPLSHIFERMAGYYTMLYYGCTIAYAESVEAMPKNLTEVQPTILISVPRVYEKFYQRITDNVAAEHGLKKSLATWALAIAEKYTEAKVGAGAGVPAALSLKYAIANALVFRKIRGRLGGRLRLMISGGAALPRQLAYFFYGLGMTITEGYGLTETSPVIACNCPAKFKFGTVGLAIPGVEVRVAEDGEILTRGPHVMKGYYKKPKETSEVINADGFFRTGDIGEFDADGFIRITDRKKDLIVTSGGKNIAPQFVENTLKTSRYISQIVVIGDKRKFPCALIVPNRDNLRKFAASNNVPESEMLTNRAVLAEVMRDIDSLSKDLASFERVKKVALLEQEFTIEAGEMTPSLKIKRNVVERKYKDLIDSLYAEAVME